MTANIVIACDSFKGSVASTEIAHTIPEIVRKRFEDIRIVGVAVADGGEGMTDAILRSCTGKTIRLQVRDPLMRPVTARYALLDGNRTAVIEMAQASGLPLLAPAERNPMHTLTYGTGELIRDALNRGCRHIVLGLGGSATNDAGLGMLQALGARFYDRQQQAVTPVGSALSRIERIDTQALDPRLRDCRFTVACDVDNPFCGTRGAARIFAPQKGAAPDDIDGLDNGLRHIARKITARTGRSIVRLPGAGAAGGLGGCCHAFFNARLLRGIDVVLETIDFDRTIAGADLIITGEGRLDRQTLNGKTPFGILQAARKQQIPVVAIGGSIEWSTELNDAGFAGIFPILPRPVPLAEAMKKPFALDNISETVVQIIRLYLSRR